MYRGMFERGRKRQYDPATIIDARFETNGWGRSCRDTV